MRVGDGAGSAGETGRGLSDPDVLDVFNAVRQKPIAEIDGAGLRLAGVASSPGAARDLAAWSAAGSAISLY